MQRNTKVAAALAALGLVGVGVAVAAGPPGGMAGRGGSAPMAGAVEPRWASGAGAMGAGMPGGRMAGMGMQVATEFDYLAQMIPHHEEAIATAELVAATSTRPELRAFTARIVTTQTAEVVRMKQWLAAWYPGRDTAVEYRPMMRDLSALSGDARDRTFLRDMIPHHMAAVMSSQQVLAWGLARHGELVPFARTVRDVQHAEIATMVFWLGAWFGDSPMGRGMHR